MFKKNKQTFYKNVCLKNSQIKCAPQEMLENSGVNNSRTVLKVFYPKYNNKKV